MTIKRKFIKHGDVIEISLPRTKGFAYLKIIDPTKIENPIDLPAFVRIYNSFHDKKISSTDELNRDLLLAPFYLVGQSAAINKYNWTILKNEPVDSSEEFIPDTKRSWPPFIEHPEKWGYIKRFDTHIIFSDYEKVKHLDEPSGKHISGIPFIIELEKLKIQGLDIKKEMGLNDWVEELMYKIYSPLPAFINLPNNMKGNATKT